MASTYSTDLKLELMATGENAGTWGTKTNTNLNLIQQAIAGYQAVSIAGGAQTTALVMSDAAISNARNAVIKLTGTITGNQVVTIPDGIEKTYIVSNGTTGAFTVQFKTVSGTGVTFGTTDKSTKTLFADGTNIVDVGNVTETGVQTITNKTLTEPKFANGGFIADANGNEEIKFTTTASAVNEITVANAATGASPTISATGGDTNIGINLTPKGTGGVVLGAGAVGTPALTTSGDLNTGIYFPAADTIAFTEGGAEAMRITSAGRVGIGITNPGTELEVRGASATLRLSESTSGGDKRMEIGVTSSGQAFIGANQSAQSIIFETVGSERMRIDSSGEVGIGTTASFSSGSGLEIQRAGVATLRCDNSTSTSAGEFRADATGTAIDCRGLEVFRVLTGGAERMRIDSSGDILIGKTASNLGTTGVQISSLGSLTLTRSGSEGININRTTNDGNLIRFYQDGTEEGNISVSGTTVSYNGFTGSHWSKFIDDSKPDVLRGTVLESLDQMTDWYAVEFEVSTTENDEIKTHKEHKPYALKTGEQVGDVITYAWNTKKKDEDGNDIMEQFQATIVKEKDVKHVMSKISDTVEAKNVYGVFSAWDNDDKINNDFYVASVGSYVVRIKAGETVNKGDLLQSNGDGTAKVQADDIVRASSFAKVLSNTVIETYEDGSFIVPCSLMC